MRIVSSLHSAATRAICLVLSTSIINCPDNLDPLHSGHSWTYSLQSNWSSEFPKCSGSGMRQSPIDIDTSSVVYNPNLSLNYNQYANKINFKVQNSLHSVSLKPSADSSSEHAITFEAPNQPSISYVLKDIHFHWAGDDPLVGSEHSVDGKRFAAEVSLVRNHV